LAVQASDLDQETLHFSLSGLPSGATLTPGVVYGSASLDWTPAAADLGNYTVTITVTDSGNGDPSNLLSSSVTFHLGVRATDHNPTINPISDPTVAEGAALNVTLTASSPDGNPLTWSASGLPAGIVLDPITGRVSGTPGYDKQGDYSVNVAVTDGHSG